MNIAEVRKAGPIEGLFKVGSEIGKGGTATVVEVEYLPTGKIYAAKLLEPGQSRDAMRKEARTGLLLRHENILPTYYYNPDNDPPFILQLRANRDSLAEMLRTGKPLPLDVVARMVAETASGVSEAHRQGIVHRDLKPTNVLLHEHDADNSIVRVGDWGNAVRVFGDPSTLTTQVAQGTLAYLAPEVVNRNAGEKSDVYSAGVMTYEMLVGRTPFIGEAGDLIVAHMTQPPPRFKEFLGSDMDDTVKNLEHVVSETLRKAPEERPTMESFARRFQAVIDEGKPQEAPAQREIITVRQPVEQTSSTEPVRTEALTPDAIPTAVLPAEPGATEILVSDLTPTKVYTAPIADQPLPEDLDVMRTEQATLRERLAALNAAIYTSEAKNAPDPLLEAERANPMIERAKEILGEDFLGVEAIRNLEKRAGDKAFVFDALPAFTYTEGDLLAARKAGEVLVLRPGKIMNKMLLQDINLNILGSFPYVNIAQYLYSLYLKRLNPGSILKESWALFSKRAVGESWEEDELNSLLRDYAAGLERNRVTSSNVRNRSIAEAVWDAMLYHSVIGDDEMSRQLGSAIYYNTSTGDRRISHHESLFYGDDKKRVVIQHKNNPELTINDTLHGKNYLFTSR